MAFVKKEPKVQKSEIWKQVQFTVIDHVQREKYELNWREYMLLDKLDILSNHPNSKNPGWCYAAKDTLADMLDVSRRHLNRMLAELMEKNYIARNPQGWYRLTISWRHPKRSKRYSDIDHRQQKRLKLKLMEYAFLTLKWNATNDFGNMKKMCALEAGWNYSQADMARILGISRQEITWMLKGYETAKGTVRYGLIQRGFLDENANFSYDIDWQKQHKISVDEKGFIFDGSEIENRPKMSRKTQEKLSKNVPISVQKCPENRPKMSPYTYIDTNSDIDVLTDKKKPEIASLSAYDRSLGIGIEHASKNVPISASKYELSASEKQELQQDRSVDPMLVQNLDLIARVAADRAKESNGNREVFLSEVYKLLRPLQLQEFAEIAVEETGQINAN